MGVFPANFFLPHAMEETQGKGINSNGSAENKKMEAEGKVRGQNGKLRKINGADVFKTGRPGRFPVKRRSAAHGFGWRRRPANGIARRVDTLRTLIPNTNGESVGLEELFTETADYILCLQRGVRLMQTLVNFMSGSDE